MKTNIIKHWGKRIFLALAIINLIVMIFYLILGSILIKEIKEKWINLILVLMINFIFMAIIYSFSISNSIYETVYQIKTDNQGYQPKFYRYLLILFGFLWLTFFITIAFYMFAEAIANKQDLDYFVTLKKDWWKGLIITCYHTFLIILHRQLFITTINKQKLPWEKK